MFYEELLGARYVDVRPLESVLDGEDAADSALGDLRRKKSKIKSYKADRRYKTRGPDASSAAALNDGTTRALYNEMKFNINYIMLITSC